ncbi:MAG TPA: hypothetical protein PLB31_09325 [Fimbriimonadaceae bacterium]|nr:hypothetical protein [Armatimonadota bacterium]HCM74113.1 hypothetical protein [Armatimonadota bacterium]HRD32471.1 hypothetical protein [Fimbriimonadaceae bacterium]HRE94572.1 hypothetical protein [Fimbriimonadaceae bacterium]HRI74654.1 hypothetical protein [Fimbriimonadaceae bacterium]
MTAAGVQHPELNGALILHCGDSDSQGSVTNLLAVTTIATYDRPHLSSWDDTMEALRSFEANLCPDLSGMLFLSLVCAIAGNVEGPFEIDLTLLSTGLEIPDDEYQFQWRGDFAELLSTELPSRLLRPDSRIILPNTNAPILSFPTAGLAFGKVRSHGEWVVLRYTEPTVAQDHFARTARALQSWGLRTCTVPQHVLAKVESIDRQVLVSLLVGIQANSNSV